MGEQIGQGGGPTWKTTGSYANTQAYNNGTTVASVAAGTDTAIWVGNDDYDNTASGPGLFTMTFGDLAYVAGYRLAIYSGSYVAAGGGFVSTSGTSAWAGDTTTITALRVVSDNGNFYGSCTLSGRP